MNEPTGSGPGRVLKRLSLVAIGLRGKGDDSCTARSGIAFPTAFWKSIVGRDEHLKTQILNISLNLSRTSPGSTTPVRFDDTLGAEILMYPDSSTETRDSSKALFKHHESLPN